MNGRRLLAGLTLAGGMAAAVPAVPGAAMAGDSAAAASPPTSHREAVIIGFNRSPRLALEPLRYADDDAIKLGAMLGLVYDQVATLVEPDDETARLYPGFVVVRPTRQAVAAALSAAARRIERAIEQGQEGELLFAYSGHGDVDREGRGLVYLADGALSQLDLAAALGAAAARYRVTLLIDACNAALLVGVRGSGSYRDRVPAERRSRELEQLNRAGLILSTSGRAEVHEWGLLLSGIFSYEVRSALLGAADLDDDRRITFAELDAFVAAANARIANPVARLAPTIRGPGGRDDAVVIDLNQARAPAFLRVAPEVVGHAFLQDAALVRHADFNKTAERGFWLMLVSSQPYAMVRGGEEHPLLVTGDSVAALGPARPTADIAGRGMLHDYLERNLFQTPFDRAFAERHWQRCDESAAPVALSAIEIARLVLAPYLLPYAVGCGLAALGGLGYGGGWIAYLGAVEAHWADETRALNTAANVLAIGGLATAAAGAVVVTGTSVVLGGELISWQLE
ncbi:MAG: caspase family protein [Deltaproteobacteria bacterium]|nr:caspase family protein [Deltaproteobacteria bacterium]